MSLFDMVQGMGWMWIEVVAHMVCVMVAMVVVHRFAQALRWEGVALDVQVACTKAAFAHLPGDLARTVVSYEGVPVKTDIPFIRDERVALRKVIDSRPPARVAAPQTMPEWATKGTVRVRPAKGAWKGAAMEQPRDEAARDAGEGKEEDERIYREVRAELARAIQAEGAIGADAGIWTRTQGAF